MEFTFAIGWIGLALLIIGALVIGVGFQFVGRGAANYEWVVTSIAAFVGAFGASELFVTLRDWQPVFDGVALIPALVGGLAVGAIVAFTMRLLLGQQVGAEAR
jgi:uncharacterized membrane protein YeaQ/YmgE (transglycosylase-associated protein family)